MYSKYVRMAVLTDTSVLFNSAIIRMEIMNSVLVGRSKRIRFCQRDTRPNDNKLAQFIQLNTYIYIYIYIYIL